MSLRVEKSASFEHSMRNLKGKESPGGACGFVKGYNLTASIPCTEPKSTWTQVLTSTPGVGRDRYGRQMGEPVGAMRSPVAPGTLDLAYSISHESRVTRVSKSDLFGAIISMPCLRRYAPNGPLSWTVSTTDGRPCDSVQLELSGLR
jgi:hypothetical protein